MALAFNLGRADAAEVAPYLNPHLPVDTRVRDLLSRMTLDEKIGQMAQADSGAVVNPADVQKYFLGAMLSGGNSKPPENNPAGWLKMVNEYQSWALKTRLKIPLLYGIDAVHGHNDVIGTVIFPHNIGLGATRDPALVEQAEHITALEMAGTGIRWSFAPCIAVAQDERWGRTYESFGQSPELVSQMATAAVKGFQGKQLSDRPDSILACAKHFVGDGGTQYGTDEGDTVCDEATLRKLYLPPYRAALRAGVESIMVSYSSWNGEKMHGNKHLLTGVLKQELGFKGFLVSDDAGIDQISPDYKTAVESAINAGLDMAMIPRGPDRPNSYVEFIQDLKALVTEGKVAQTRINDAVFRILRVKFEMGLFEHPYTSDPALAAAIGSPAHRQVARQCVRESLVLLKNENHTLPLSKKVKHLVVVGAAADDLGIQCGGWTIDWQGRTGEATTGGTTILAAIRRTVSPETQVTYSPDAGGITNADAVIAVVGEMPYAEWEGNAASLDLDPGDAALVEKAKASGAPVTTILLSGRPLILGSALDNSSAFIAAWLPGTEGQGVADVLFGDYKPTGKLPREWPRSMDQAAANDMTGEPLFPFGFGLTY
ncbi:MAG TPA: glycoside hydrolase family 3 N-terminal domain-containing protein [Verrucomicrobiae bacterium]|nr:glycoside hydrolase family 3 N-terminal domain-containing protein [Verrucomicrobiae bacterium]